MTKNIIKSNRAIIDIENGGFSRKAGIVEVAIVVIDQNFQVLDKYSQIIERYFQQIPEDPENTEEPMRYDDKATEIHGITEKDQENNGKPPREVVKEIEDIIQTYNVTELIGHNIKAFDAKRMAVFMDRFSTYKINPFIELELTCTMEMAKFTLSLGSYSLSNCCHFFDIINEDKHRALSDAIATMELLKMLES